MVPVCDKQYHIYNRFRHFWAEIRKLWNYPLTLRGGYYNYTLRHVANLFNKVILCIQGHAVMSVQVYANSFIGKRIMNIEKWEVRRNVHYPYSITINVNYYKQKYNLFINDLQTIFLLSHKHENFS